MPIELKTERSCLGDLLFVYTNVLLLNMLLSTKQHDQWRKKVTRDNTPSKTFDFKAFKSSILYLWKIVKFTKYSITTKTFQSINYSEVYFVLERKIAYFEKKDR